MKGMRAQSADESSLLSSRDTFLIRRSASDTMQGSSLVSERFSSCSASSTAANRIGDNVRGGHSQKGGSMFYSRAQSKEIYAGPRGSALTTRHQMPASSRVLSVYPSRSVASRRANEPQSWKSTESTCSIMSTPSGRLPKARSGTSGFFIPPARAVDVGKLVVVLDLDETLVYSRSGPIVQRPGVSRLLDALRGRCEVVVWTAGERLYAMEVIQKVDPNHCIQHCIYRDKKWWTERSGYVKDVSELGRPLDQILIIDNTPDCLRSNPRNGLLVTDFRGAKGSQSKLDTTLFVLADVIDDVLRGPVVSVDAFHKHPQLQLRQVQCDSGGSVEVLTLRQDPFTNAPRIHILLPYKR